MTNYRYPGIKPFQTQDKDVFFGRKTDTEKLFKLITVEKTVLLYSKSGLGKSSLLNAGIIPLIEIETDYIPISIRFYAHNPENSISPLQSTLSKIEKQFSQTTFIEPFIKGKTSLWLYCKKFQIENPDKKLLLIFDQFEELFTYPEIQILEFKKQLAELLFTAVPQSLREQIKTQRDLFSREQVELLYTPMNTKSVFSIRSDRMSLLNQLTDSIPNIQQIFYELKPLNDKQALEAILIPAQKEGDFHSQSFDFEEDARKQIIDFLTQHGKRNIESFQLQMICQHCENKIIEQKDLKLISSQNLGNVESLFNDYYENAIYSLDNEIDRTAARIFIEEKLIVDERRISLDKVLCIKSVSESVLQNLTESRLLRAEPNTTDGISYELCHDTMVAPILESQKQRNEENKILQTRQQAIKKTKRRLRTLISVLLVLLLSVIIVFSIQLHRKNEELIETNTAITKAYKELSQLIVIEHDSIGRRLPLNEQIEKAKMSAFTISDLVDKFEKTSQMLDTMAITNEVTQKKIIELANLYNAILREMKRTQIIERIEIVKDSLRGFKRKSFKREDLSSQDWIIAKQKNTILAYQNYLDRHSQGKHREEALTALQNLKNKDKKKIQLTCKRKEFGMTKKKVDTAFYYSLFTNYLGGCSLEKCKVKIRTIKNYLNQVCHINVPTSAPIEKKVQSDNNLEKVLVSMTEDDPRKIVIEEDKKKYKTMEYIRIRINHVNREARKITGLEAFARRDKIPKFNEATELDFFKATQEFNSIVAYEQYQLHYPNGQYKKETQHLIEGLFNYPLIDVKQVTFTMGNIEGESDENILHTVTLSPYRIGKYEVTQAQWEAVMLNNPSNFKGCSDCPVENVSWEDVQEFIRRLNRLTGKTYRLPTEAEWEYAASQTKNVNETEFGTIAWYYLNSDAKTHSVGKKNANILGIYDMNGNVLEWCSDKYGAYSSKPTKNPHGALIGNTYVARGGSWNYNRFRSLYSSRYNLSPKYKSYTLGFRLVLDK